MTLKQNDCNLPGKNNRTVPIQKGRLEEKRHDYDSFGSIEKMAFFAQIFSLINGGCKECRCATNSHLPFFHRKNLARHWMADSFAAVVANEILKEYAQKKAQKI